MRHRFKRMLTSQVSVYTAIEGDRKWGPTASIFAISLSLCRWKRIRFLINDIIDSQLLSRWSSANDWRRRDRKTRERKLHGQVDESPFIRMNVKRKIKGTNKVIIHSRDLHRQRLHSSLFNRPSSSDLPRPSNFFFLLRFHLLSGFREEMKESTCTESTTNESVVGT